MINHNRTPEYYAAVAARRQRVLDMALDTTRIYYYKDMASILDCSYWSIRNDLTWLRNNGLLPRTKREVNHAFDQAATMGNAQ